MERLLQWAWDRYATRYSWVIGAVAFVVGLPIYLLLSFAIVDFEKSSRYLGAAAAAGVAALLVAYSVAMPGHGGLRLVERWAAREAVDPVKALEATYVWSRGAVVRSLAVIGVGTTLLSVAVGLIASATGVRLVQIAVWTCAFGLGATVIGVHSLAETLMRPPRVALTGDTGIGDSLPRPRPTFATWSSLSVLAVTFVFSIAGAMLTAVVNRATELPVLWVVIGVALTLVFGVPVTVGAVFAPSLQPIRDLADGTKRVAAGDYSRPLPVVQDDDLGALTASFNRMQAGLAERRRLQGAFGMYVDPWLAARLLEQGDDVFTGERREVTVMFVDVRDFTSFAEAHTAEDTVARLNALFEVVVPAVVDAGGHVNKYLGDGALAVFNAPNDLADHADAAASAALRIQRLVPERFGGELRIGIGINTGGVIAGTIGGGGKLEFTLIGDAVNVAARVEELTKTTGDAILLTNQTVDALILRPSGLTERGLHPLKGKSAEVRVFALQPSA